MLDLKNVIWYKAATIHLWVFDVCIFCFQPYLLCLGCFGCSWTCSRLLSTWWVLALLHSSVATNSWQGLLQTARNKATNIPVTAVFHFSCIKNKWQKFIRFQSWSIRLNVKYFIRIYRGLTCLVYSLDFCFCFFIVLVTLLLTALLTVTVHNILTYKLRIGKLQYLKLKTIPLN